MSILKDNITTYWQLFKGIGTVTRVMSFEKFSSLFFFFYLLTSLSIALVLSVMHWGIGIGYLLIALVFYTKVLNNMQFLKRMLIFKGDRIEYAEPSSEDNIFKKAEVVLKMRPDEVKKTKLISNEFMQDNQHFYLVKQDKDVKVIAYDWILGLSPELLEEDFLQ